MTSAAQTGSAQAALLPPAAPTRAAADSTQRRDHRLRLPIAWVLIVGFGGLVALAVARVLFVGALSNVQNTFTLLHQSGTLRLDTIETHIRDQLDPVECLGRGLAARIAAGSLDAEDSAQFRATLRGVLGALPQLTGIGYATRSGRAVAIGYWTGRDGEATLQDYSDDPLMRAHLKMVAGAREPLWSDPVWLDELDQVIRSSHC